MLKFIYSNAGSKKFSRGKNPRRPRLTRQGRERITLGRGEERRGRGRERGKGEKGEGRGERGRGKGGGGGEGGELTLITFASLNISSWLRA